MLAPRGIARPGNVRAIETAFRKRTPDAHELLRLRIGKRPEKECVNRGEKDGVGADAECERDDREDREPGLAEQLAQSVTEVIHDM